MGCDIHLHVELKVDGKWHHYDNVKIGRNYDLFGLMAGVRSIDFSPIVDPKGFPPDASDMVRYQFGYDSYFHTPSWLNEDEIELLKERAKEEGIFNYSFEHETMRGSYLFHNDYTKESLKSLQERYPHIEGYRFVFWFDS